MSRHLLLIAFCAGLLASAGCSSERRLPTDPGPPLAQTGPTAPSDPQRLAALALLDAAGVHAGVTTSPLTSATVDGKVVWTNGPCDIAEHGSLQASLDGGSAPTSGTLLPTGSHTYVVSFSNCLVDGWAMTLNGVASAAYTAAEWNNVTATVSADSVRGRYLAFLSGLNDVTADGSAVWTSVGSGTKTTTYTPAPGSRLVNNSTANVATFGGGSYSLVRYETQRWEQRFDNLKVAINGTEYTLNGSLDSENVGSQRTHTGEVRIIHNGTLVARVYGDVRNALTIEVLVPLVPL
jgi:hypothetical protein